MNKYRQSSTIVVLVISCCTFVACSSNTSTNEAKPSGASSVVASPDPSAQLAPPPGPPPVYQGAIDTITCAGISGWVWNRSNGAEKVSIDLLVDSKLVGTTTTNILLPDLKDLTGVANPNYGFGWPIPPELKDGKAHVVSAKISGGTQEVPIWERIKPSFTCSAS